MQKYVTYQSKATLISFPRNSHHKYFDMFFQISFYSHTNYWSSLPINGTLYLLFRDLFFFPSSYTFKHLSLSTLSFLTWVSHNLFNQLSTHLECFHSYFFTVTKKQYNQRPDICIFSLLMLLFANFGATKYVPFWYGFVCLLPKSTQDNTPTTSISQMFTCHIIQIFFMICDAFFTVWNI